MAIYTRNEQKKFVPMNIPTLKGDKGEKGEQGLPGKDGATGKDGITPDIQIGTVTTLDPGQKATVTKRGTKENPVFDFGIPRGKDGADGNNTKSNLILRYVHNSNPTIQPTALDTSTGVFTCKNHGLRDGSLIVARQNSFTDSFLSIHSELFAPQNTSLSVAESTNDTFKIKKGGTVINSYAEIDNSKANISNYHFEVVKNTKLDFTDIVNDGNLEIEMYGSCGVGDLYVSLLKNGQYSLANNTVGFGHNGAAPLSTNATHAYFRPIRACVSIRKTEFGFIFTKELMQYLITGRTVFDRSVNKGSIIVQYPYDDFDGIRLGSNVHSWVLHNGFVVEIYNSEVNKND